MQVDKIQQFYSSYDNYLKTKTELSALIAKLECIREEVNYDLNTTIDNGLEQLDLTCIADEYHKHKFASPEVQDLLGRIDDLLFKDLDTSLKDTLEVVSMQLDVHDSICYKQCSWEFGKSRFSLCINFMHYATHKQFSLNVPIKQSVHTDVDNWQNDKNGLYVVKAVSDRDKPKVICCVFDKSKVVDAVRKYLTGAFDEELSHKCILWTDIDGHTLGIDVGYYEIYTDANNFYYKTNNHSKFIIPEMKSCVDDRKLYV